MVVTGRGTVDKGRVPGTVNTHTPYEIINILLNTTTFVFSSPSNTLNKFPNGRENSDVNT